MDSPPEEALVNLRIFYCKPCDHEIPLIRSEENLCPECSGPLLDRGRDLSAEGAPLEGCSPKELTDAIIDLWRKGGKEIEGLLGRVAERLRTKE